MEKEFYSAYYYTLESTGCPEIDEILKEIASAGKGCHSTEDWAEFGYIEKIQAAANKAAERIKSAQLQRAADVCQECGAINAFEYDKECRGDICVRCGTRR